MIQTKSIKTVRPTDAVLSEFADLERTDIERPLSKSRLEYLRGQLAAGNFHTPPKWSYCYCRFNGRKYRLNGQHTSVVLAERPEDQRPLVTLEEYECDTLDEVARLFSQFDSKEGARTNSDINRAVFNTDSQLSGYPVRLGQALVSAVAMLENADREWASEVRQEVKSNSSKKSAMEKAGAAIQFAGFATWLKDEFGSNQAAALLGRAPAICAMLATRRVDQQAAETFWKEVRDGTNPNPKSGSRVLREYLLAVRLSSSSSANTRNAAGQREVLYKSLQAWTAWRTGADCRLSYRETSLLPVVS